MSLLQTISKALVFPELEFNNSSTHRKNFIWFAGFAFPTDSALTHFAFVGSSGSGKTINQRFLYQTAISKYIGKIDPNGEGVRALLYDAKGDMHSILYGQGVNERFIKTLNPFDNRSYAWDIAKDVQDEATALEIANILIPENENDSQPFFRDSARDILSGVLTAYVYESPNNWTLRDVLYPLLCGDISVLQNVLQMSEYSIDRLQYLNHDKTFQNILSTIRTELKPLQIIASLWYRASLKGKTISLENWVKNPCGEALILGNSYKLKESLKTVNQVIFKRISQLLLDLPDIEKNSTRRSWICLDELAQLGKLDGLNDLLTNGRSKGVCNVIGFQDFDGLKDIYGEDIANVIFGQCASKAFFRLGSGSSAKWASEQFGEKERFENTNSRGESSNAQTGTTYNWETSEKVEKRDAVLSQEFLTMKATNPKNGLTGFYISPYIKEFLEETSFIKSTIKGSYINTYLLPKESSNYDFENNKRPKEHQKSIAWTKEDFDRLGVKYSSKPFGYEKTEIEVDLGGVGSK
jgi:hypothetical protein